MTGFTSDQYLDEWERVLAQPPDHVKKTLSRLATQHAAELASHFYACMLGNPVTASYLTHEQVKTRLHASMQRWIVSVFESESSRELAQVIVQQKQAGMVHARIGLPVHLVLRGARSLKANLVEKLIAEPSLDERERMEAARLMGALVDLSMEIMGQEYANSHDHGSRTEEAYRLFSVVQNVAAERERQRAALLDWENQLMFSLAVDVNMDELPRLASSEFGLWFLHKGAHAFEGAAETGLIMQAMERLDDTILPRLGASSDGAERVQCLRDLREQAKAVGFHLDALFQQSNELDAGRDVLTNLLNRKFLPVVMSKEVAYSRQKNTTFAVLMLDVDHFKNINDTYGHDAGDTVLQQLAVLLSNSSRAGDSIFRLGGEEFLLLMVAVDRERALHIAERVRSQVAAEAFRLPMDQAVKVTVSIGLALHDGHPDYQRTMRSADKALYEAKRQGRNLVVVGE